MHNLIRDLSNLKLTLTIVLGLLFMAGGVGYSIGAKETRLEAVSCQVMLDRRTQLLAKIESTLANDFKAEVRAELTQKGESR